MLLSGGESPPAEGHSAVSTYKAVRMTQACQIRNIGRVNAAVSCKRVCMSKKVEALSAGRLCTFEDEKALDITATLVHHLRLSCNSLILELWTADVICMPIQQ